jgi:hypothetical protein
VSRYLFNFRWRVYPGCYRWVSVSEGRDAGTQRILTRLKDCPSDHTYDPLRPAGLFRDFAKVEPTEEGILAFVEKKGMLSECEPAFNKADEEKLRAEGKRVAWSGDPSGECVFGGENIGEWQREITAMKHVVQLWDLIREQNDRDLHNHVTWLPARKSGSYVIAFRPDSETPWPKQFNNHPGIITLSVIPPPPARSPYPRGDVYHPVVEYLEGTINEHLLADISPQVGWDSSVGHLVLSFVPNSLKGALWLGLAQAVNANAEHRLCDECGKPFEVSRTASRTAFRSNRLFCTNACRSKAYRGRQEKAREMFNNGKSVEEIVAALEARADAVKGWIKNTKQEG